MVHTGCVFVASIHLSRIWTSGSFESVRWITCGHRLDLGLCFHPKEFLGNGVRIPVNSKGKLPSTGGLEEGWTHGTATRGTVGPTHYWLSYSGLQTQWGWFTLWDIKTRSSSGDKTGSTMKKYRVEHNRMSVRLKRESGAGLFTVLENPLPA